MNTRISYIVDGAKQCLGFLLERGCIGIEAFDRDERSLGVFKTMEAAARAVINAVAEHE